MGVPARLFGCKLGSLAERFKHAPFVCLSCAGNVECRSMIDRCPDDGKSDGDIYAGFNSEHLDGPMALIVIHGDHHIVVAALREEEERIGRQRSNYIPTLFAASFDGGCNFLGFFSVTEESIFSGMGIDTAHTYLRISVARLDKHRMRTPDSSLDESWLNLCNRIDEANVGGDMRDLQFRRARSEERRVGKEC